ncbi:hypothetical protein [Mucilaginibacter sp.]|uniref:hypothetical protein n=1 Tax=Mucilaginibacter sp. TaxID=1882438 RepID=UPI002851C3FB|nr:hypothetical protein [Mucilaginibacter sp.]MDR3696089.1 hypothetical protein [Mucilaginibacter sp.]
MEFNNEEFLKAMEQSKNEHEEPKAWRVEDDDILNEDDRERDLLVNSDEKKPVGKGNVTGCENCDKNNLTTSVNDKKMPETDKNGARYGEREHIET